MITDYYHIDEAIFQSAEFIHRIEKNVNSIFELIFNIEKYRTVQREGGFTHLSTKQLTPIIKETMNQVINNFPKKNVNFHLDINESMKYLINSNEFIEDVFVNLFSNAIKHNDREQVEIDLTIRSNLVRGVDYWVVSIRDNGPGIPEEKKKYLFTMEDAANEMMDEFLQKMRKEYPKLAPIKKATPLLVVGTPVTRILEIAKKKKAKMIFVGSHGRTGLSHLLVGSKAERVVQLSPIPVVVVKTSREK